MRGYVTAARVAAVVALLAVPPLIMADAAAAADRQYKGPKPSSNTDPRNVMVLPRTKQGQDDFLKGLCVASKGIDRPLEAKDCKSHPR
jgi:hypothetical protein